MSYQAHVDLAGFHKATGEAAIKRGQYALINQAMSDMEQFVPKDQGHLRDSVHASSNGSQITYTMPYAQAQFHGMINGSRIHNYTTPGTSRRWDLKAKSMFMDSWVKAFTEGAK